MLCFHDVADGGVRPVFVLHLALRLQILKVEGHLCFPYLLCGIEQLMLTVGVSNMPVKQHPLQFLLSLERFLDGSFELRDAIVLR